MSKTISVLTVCWNSSATIEHTINSFLSQTHQDKEMLILDGGSSDDTVEIARSFESDQIRIFSEPDNGMYDGLNKGLGLFSGDAVGVLNSDDTYHNEHVLGRISQTLDHADMVHGWLNFVDDHSSKRLVRRWRVKDRQRNGFSGGWMPAHPTFYVRRQVAETVGLFDLQYKTASDYDWMLRAIELNNFSLLMLEEVMIDMMIGGKSTASIRGYFHHNHEALRSRRSWLGAGVLDFATIAKPLQKLRQFLR